MKVIKAGYMDNGTGQHQSNTVISTEGLSPAITTLQGGTQQIKILVRSNMQVKSYGSIYGSDKGTGYAGNVWDKSQLCPSLTTSQGGNRQPMIVAMRGRNPDNPSDRRGGIPLEQRLEPNQEGICNCLTQLYKDNLVMEKVKHIGNVNPSGKGQNGSVIDSEGLARTVTVEKGEGMKALIKQNNKQGYAECELGGVADLSYPDSKTRRGRVQEGGQVSLALTVTDLGGINRIESKWRIRKLTPLECWRLMGFTDEEFKAAEAVNSNTQLYKQAGNSIVVDVLVGIFRNIIGSMEVNDMMQGTFGRFTVDALQLPKMFDINKLREAEPDLFEDLCKDYPVEAGNVFISIKSE